MYYDTTLCVNSNVFLGTIKIKALLGYSLVRPHRDTQFLWIYNVIVLHDILYYINVLLKYHRSVGQGKPKFHFFSEISLFSQLLYINQQKDTVFQTTTT